MDLVSIAEALKSQVSQAAESPEKLIATTAIGLAAGKVVHQGTRVVKHAGTVSWRYRSELAMGALGVCVAVALADGVDPDTMRLDPTPSYAMVATTSGPNSLGLIDVLGKSSVTFNAYKVPDQE